MGITVFTHAPELQVPHRMTFETWCLIRLGVIKKNLEAQQWDWQRQRLTYERRGRFRTLYLEVARRAGTEEDLEWA